MSGQAVRGEGAWHSNMQRRMGALSCTGRDCKRGWNICCAWPEAETRTEAETEAATEAESEADINLE